eukprot:TRINITY_DN447_c0_g1_i3.p1 TRINITY_DN447_c0_g1~~TRINITY_DN447_c0_g1_i3.p1  ORF type:complete len:173 (+),score=59.51 TRINITY_DN447_c0_g1_i3:151-669(+)
MFEKLIVIDCRGHLLGRLASFVAKEALAGQKIMLVRAEDINISGSFMRNKLNLLMKRHKRMSTNPRRGPFHHHSPADMLMRTIRGMLPHKIYKGSAALQRIKAVDGCPAPFDKVKKMVVPAALRVTRLRPGRKYCTLKRLATETGWKYQDVVEKYEAKRKANAAKWYESKKN